MNAEFFINIMFVLFYANQTIIEFYTLLQSKKFSFITICPTENDSFAHVVHTLRATRSYNEHDITDQI